ncbi:unnamed protein product [Didymodactylos carnosus]|uniref:Inositol polyphosphate-related phosphatase domain-containing protein n=1 Tax=Didymodactylos carnosus TaxID=1234261 RepID=A0A813TH15_9BILA|nr:unnamed protein product [Didymodactylos carnosus]CAF0934730.1 unnamed protein product [Didymodactylos carnosus]CAF3596470.1 unnamed protein product [Didymodactylos carnosus]CAF3710592.1 unnamed protein product [Didymodactylos carnosus]
MRDFLKMVALDLDNVQNGEEIQIRKSCAIEEMTINSTLSPKNQCGSSRSVANQFYILCGTFNVNNRQIPSNSDFTEWLCPSTTQIPSLIAVGLQEIANTGNISFSQNDKIEGDEWENIINKTIENCSNVQQNQYKLISRVRLLGMLLFVYVERKHYDQCKLISTAFIPTGFMNIFGNKGGVGIRFRFHNQDLCFINCHLTAGDNQLEKRNDDYKTIESRMTFMHRENIPKWWKIDDHDIIFWFGDMNYRLAHPNEQVRQAIKQLSFIPLKEKDQLQCQIKLGKVFQNYHEPPINFLPTYKFNINTDVYDTSEKFRTPSWTDRILYKFNHEHYDVKSHYYNSSPSIRFSDHRPVSALFSVTMKHSHDENNTRRMEQKESSLKLATEQNLVKMMYDSLADPTINVVYNPLPNGPL